jgi:hypothetical protein
METASTTTVAEKEPGGEGSGRLVGCPEGPLECGNEGSQMAYALGSVIQMAFRGR